MGHIAVIGVELIMLNTFTLTTLLETLSPLEPAPIM
jgi:hypothetical protein